jgi:hypothetical protein
MYGAGKVEIWDRGEYEIISREQGKIEVILNGKKLNGQYVLLNFKENNWLFFKSESK